ncbi:MAG: T9SS type A sorting domain-containing protein, partial [Bacteroidetes bacterium]|nr:T9SS type A sorting domain-containing protein [Bacteroidota bacterium]
QATAQWTAQNSGTTQDLHDLYFVNSNIGVAVGDAGTVLKTVNGGNDWDTIPSMTAQSHYGIYFLDDSVGYILGQYSGIFKTTDQGNTWTGQTVHLTQQGLRDIHFVDSNVGYLTGLGGQIYKSVDGGASWTRQFPGTTAPLWACCFLDPDTGYAVGGYDFDDSRLLLKTVDGGNNWQIIIPSSSGTYEDVFFTSADTGYIVQSNLTSKVLKTTDGGNSWEEVFSHFSVPKAIHFVNNSSGYLVGQFIAKTLDSGSNWFIHNHNGGLVYLNAVTSPAIDTAYAVGRSGVILKTVNGGGALGIKKNVLKPTIINLYPNPFNSYSTIEFNHLKKGGNVLIIYNSLGLLVRTINNINTGHIRIERDELANGLYFFQIRNNSEIIGNGKFILGAN